MRESGKTLIAAAVVVLYVAVGVVTVTIWMELRRTKDTVSEVRAEVRQVQATAG
ncbi:hypothetical protein LCGC14_3105650, partial [marine sediment metagenome]